MTTLLMILVLILIAALAPFLGTDSRGLGEPRNERPWLV